MSEWFDPILVLFVLVVFARLSRAWRVTLMALAITASTVYAGWAVFYYGFLYNDYERYQHDVKVLRAVNRHREKARCIYSAEFCSGPLYWWASSRQFRLRREWKEARDRPHEARVARVERIQLPIETPVDPDRVALR